MTTLTAIYSQLPEQDKATVQRILQECNKSKATSSFVLGIAKNKVLPILAKVNPQEAFETSLKEMELDWETTFDLLSAEKTNLLQKVLWDVYTRPSINLLLGIKIPKDLERSERLIFGKILVIAAAIHYSEKQA